MIENLFVKEVVRIIRKKLYQDGHGLKSVVLVSGRFHSEAVEEMGKNEDIFGESPRNQIRILDRPVCPAWWLTDYEFEVLPQKTKR